jgi:DNA-binding transcriptional ArsR family regulator
LKGKIVAAHQDEIFKAMADPHRRRILGELCQQSREAGELARMVGLAPNALSFHLRALKSADLVSVRREGRYLRYSLEADSLQSWRRQVDQLFPAAMTRAGSPAASPVLEADKTEPADFTEPETNPDQLPTELL